jgi:hypothetical protein
MDAPEPYAITVQEAMERLGATRKVVAKLINHCVLDNSRRQVEVLVKVSRSLWDLGTTRRRSRLARCPLVFPNEGHWPPGPWRPLRIEDLSGKSQSWTQLRPDRARERIRSSSGRIRVLLHLPPRFSSYQPAMSPVALAVNSAMRH